MIDISRRALYRDDELVPLFPKVFDLLMVLVEDSGRVVSKAELLERVWPGTFVEEGSLTQNISVLRKCVAPYFPGQDPIETVPRRGYRFTAEVRLHQARPAPDLAVPPTRAQPMAHRWIVGTAAIVLLAAIVMGAWSLTAHGPGPTRRSVAVFAPNDLSGQPQSAWLATALAETLSTELGANSDLRMISGQTVAVTRRELNLGSDAILTPKVLEDLHRNLSCDYVLAGNYLPMNGQLRLDLRLMDARSGENVAVITLTDDARNLLSMVSRSGGLLRARLGLPQRSGGQGDLQGTVSTNPEAQRLYFDGLAHLRQNESAEAQRLFQQSTAADPTYPLAHYALAVAWRQLGYEHQATVEARRAMELSGKLSREERLRVEAATYEAAAQWNKAAETYRSLWRFFPDTLEYALALGTTEFHQNHPAEMLRLAAQLRQAPAPAGNDPRIDLMESTAAHMLSDYSRALAAAERAGKEAVARKNLALVGAARERQALNTDFLGDPDRARRLYSEAADLYESIGDSGQSAYSLRLDADILVRRGQFDEAEREFASALAITRRIGYDQMTTRILFGYSNLERQRNNIGPARQMIEEAMTLARKTGDESVRTNLLNNHGHVLRLEGDLEGARADFEESLKIARAAGSRAQAAEALTYLAMLDVNAGNWDAARREVSESIAIKRQLGHQDSLALSLPLFAAVLTAEGDREGARQAWAQECTIHESHHQPRALVECQLHSAQLDLATAAAPELRAAVDRFKPDYSQIAVSESALNLYARLQLAAGQPQAAAASIATARRLLDRGAHIPERALPVAITSGRIDVAQRRNTQAARTLSAALAEAERLHYAPLAEEARQALATVSH